MTFNIRSSVPLLLLRLCILVDERWLAVTSHRPRCEATLVLINSAHTYQRLLVSCKHAKVTSFVKWQKDSSFAGADRYYVYEVSPDTGIGQSSSVILDQKTQIMTTERRVNRVSKSAPSILPLVPVHMCMLITYWNIWPMAKRRAAPIR